VSVGLPAAQMVDLAGSETTHFLLEESIGDRSLRSEAYQVSPATGVAHSPKTAPPDTRSPQAIRRPPLGGAIRRVCNKNGCPRTASALAPTGLVSLRLPGPRRCGASHR
jgi:hypothetical protein